MFSILKQNNWINLFTQGCIQEFYIYKVSHLHKIMVLNNILLAIVGNSGNVIKTVCLFLFNFLSLKSHVTKKEIDLFTVPSVHHIILNSKGLTLPFKEPLYDQDIQLFYSLCISALFFVLSKGVNDGIADKIFCDPPSH